MNVSGQGNQMDKLFHKKLSEFEVSPEAHVWEGIARKLDESQKRPGLFGSWWTILLSIAIMLLVTVAGAFMLYKKAFQQKAEKNPNRDLPYMQQTNHEEGTAYFDPSEIRTIVATPHQSIQKNYSSDRHQNYPTSAKSAEVGTSTIQATNEMKSSEKGLNVSYSNAPVIDQTTNSTDQFKANDLIVSSDSDFYTNIVNSNKAFSYAYLPLKESFLRKETEQLTSPRLIDGCNVYRNNNTHFFLDVYYAPEIASRSLATKDPALQSYLDERANSERPILSYSAGIKASLVFGNGLTIRTGLSYSNNSERFDYIKETQKITKEIKDQNGNVIRTEISELVIMDKIYNRYKFIDIPILVGYETDLKDFILSVNGGIGINVLASESGKIYKDTKNPRSFYLLENNGDANNPIFRSSAGISLIGSIGLNYKYNERIMLLFEPSARYYTRSLSDPSNPISQNYLFLGMNIGMRYRIK